MNLYDIKVKPIDQPTITLNNYKNQTILIVNTASNCGLKNQLEELETLYQDYKDCDFTVLGFPCNQFLGQEPLDGMEIQNFCATNFNVTFPLFEKVKVNGKHTHPLFATLKERTGLKLIKWNYNKFLVSPNADVVKQFSPIKSPIDLREEIEMLLPAD